MIFLLSRRSSACFFIKRKPPAQKNAGGYDCNRPLIKMQTDASPALSIHIASETKEILFYSSEVELLFLYISQPAKAPGIFRITSSISRLPRRVIHCTSSIIKTVATMTKSVFLKLFNFGKSFGRKYPRGIKTPTFPIRFIILCRIR